MKPNIHEGDIRSEVCQQCAACCNVVLKVAATESRYRVFLRQVGFRVLPPPAAGKKDCCSDRHDIDIDMGPCRHLRTRAAGEAGPRYSCALHGTPELPELCADFNCVSWAKAFNQFDTENAALRQAVQAIQVIEATRDATNGAPVARGD